MRAAKHYIQYDSIFVIFLKQTQETYIFFMDTLLKYEK